ncbi:MAG: hypothetical protein N4A38_01170 [Candidatus Gracilibacteria bacterium]|nr:hypothetical protein [Candidatus Gracilibacteria bacterium]
MGNGNQYLSPVKGNWSELEGSLPDTINNGVISISEIGEQASNISGGVNENLRKDYSNPDVQIKTATNGTIELIMKLLQS